MRRTAATIVLAFAATAVAGPAHAADPPTPGGCKEFGQNVAFLGTNLGRDFGKAASEAATSGPRVFRDNVVKREQRELCP